MEAVLSKKRQILRALFQEYPGSAAYIFGSYARGKTGPMSDYDFGVLFQQELSANKLFDLKIRLLSELTTILNSNMVDLVVLNEAPVNIAMAVINGCLLYEKN